MRRCLHILVVLLINGTLAVSNLSVLFNASSNEPDQAGSPNDVAHPRRKSSREGAVAQAVVHVYQHHGLAPLVPDDVCDARRWMYEYDLVTVEYSSKAIVRELVFMLPERQQCGRGKRGAGMLCTGHEFVVGKEAGPHEVPCNGDAGLLSNSSMASDATCVVDNTRGDVKIDDLDTAGLELIHESPRAAAIVKLTASISPEKKAGKSRAPQQGNEGSFTFRIRNPLVSPQGRDRNLREANSFEIYLRDDNGRNIRTAVYPAREIAMLWVCSYSEWVKTDACTAKCGSGVRYHMRKLLNPPPAELPLSSQSKCNERVVEEEPCHTWPCDVDCKLGDWVGFADGQCSKTCGGGIMAERRREVDGAIGKGKACPHWQDESRFHYADCNEDPCPPELDALPSAGQQRCITAWHGAYNSLTTGIVRGECSSWCGSAGTQVAFEPALMKDTGKEEWCPHFKSLPCNTDRECGLLKLHFYPAVPRAVPVQGEWYDLAVVFYVTREADSLTLVAPTGFEIRTKPPSSERSKHEYPTKISSGWPNDYGQEKVLKQPLCAIGEHSLPRLERCSVWTKSAEGGNKSLAFFQFANVLEVVVPAGTLDEKWLWQLKQRKKNASITKRNVMPYHVRLQVKIPEACTIDEEDAELCAGDPAWSMIIDQATPDAAAEKLIFPGSFRVHRRHRPIQRHKLDLPNVVDDSADSESDSDEQSDDE